MTERWASDDTGLIGSDEAASILHVHRATVLRWAADPTNPLTAVHEQPGRNGIKLFRRAQVNELAQKRGLVA